MSKHAKTKHLSAAAFAALSLAAGFGVTEARADLNVFVGYADSLRASGFFPTPWLTSTGVVSQSSTAQLFDAGAIRIDNTGATAVTISNLSASNFDNGAVFSFWNPLTIPAGGTGIFTQTFQYNFDTSDQSTNGGTPPGNILPLDPGGNGIGGCSSSASAQSTAGITAQCNATQPLVSFSDNGGMTIVSFSDKGHILDTGNYDFVSQSPDGNESINWNVIGHEANRGGTVPEPSTWAMMLVGFASLGYAGFRASRKRRTVFAEA